jgi:four helix bundle protein
MYRFEKLRVYHGAVKLVKKIYLLADKLPKDEKFALIDQLKRASTSIVLNIAEGTGSRGDKEFKSFLKNALKSLYETVAAIKIAESLFGIRGEKALDKCDLVGKQLNSLIKSLAKD